MEKSSDDRTTNVIIIGDSMLNNVNSRGLSNQKCGAIKLKLLKVELLNFPGVTSTDVVNKVDDILVDKPQSLIVHVGTNDLTNDVNLLNNVKKIVSRIKKKSPNTAISFSNIIIRKDRKNLGKSSLIQTEGLKTIVSEKNIGLTANENLKETTLV